MLLRDKNWKQNKISKSNNWSISYCSSFVICSCQKSMKNYQMESMPVKIRSSMVYRLGTHTHTGRLIMQLLLTPILVLFPENSWLFNFSTRVPHSSNQPQKKSRQSKGTAKEKCETQGTDAKRSRAYPVDPFWRVLQLRCGNRAIKLLDCDAEDAEGWGLAPANLRHLATCIIVV